MPCVGKVWLERNGNYHGVGYSGMYACRPVTYITSWNIQQFRYRTQYAMGCLPHWHHINWFVAHKLLVTIAPQPALLSTGWRNKCLCKDWSHIPWPALQGGTPSMWTWMWRLSQELKPTLTLPWVKNGRDCLMAETIIVHTFRLSISHKDWSHIPWPALQGGTPSMWTWMYVLHGSTYTKGSMRSDGVNLSTL